MTKYIRYSSGSGSSYGILDGGTVRETRGSLFGSPTETGVSLKLSDVKLLYPCQPGKILAVGLNYKSHFGSRPQPDIPGMFYKPISALQDPDGPIVVPQEATEWQKLVDEMAAEDDEVSEYIHGLEERDQEGELREASGDSIAKEFERYLRRRDDGPGGSSGAGPGGFGGPSGPTSRG